jgi:hypothetical protein
MLELICDQAYTWAGVPADKSPYRNHGSAFNTTGDFDGFEPGSGIIKFPRSDSRIRISTTPCWQQLIALKIDVLVKVAPKASRQAVLAAGDGSFRFGLVEGLIEGQFSSPSGTDNVVRSGDAFAPDHKPHFVPGNKWVKLGFYHDGFAKMRLFIDDELVGESVILGGVPPVQGLGVSIGNDIINDGFQFPGEIDEISIWRLDPKAMEREFLNRPYTKKAADCWRALFEDIHEWRENNSEQYRNIVQQISEFENSFVRSCLLAPDSEQARLNAILTSFVELWSSGRITGPEMKKVLCELILRLRSVGIDHSFAVDNDTLDILIGIGNRTYEFNCDHAVNLFLKLLHDAMENCDNSKEVKHGN